MMFRLHYITVFIYNLHILFFVGELEESFHRLNTSGTLQNNLVGNRGQSKWIIKKLKYFHPNDSFKTELHDGKAKWKKDCHWNYAEKRKDVTLNHLIDKNYRNNRNKKSFISSSQLSEHKNLIKYHGNNQTRSKKRSNQKHNKSNNKRFMSGNIALQTDNVFSNNNEDNFNKIRHIIGQDYDYNNALLQLLTSNDERKIPSNYKVLYNEDFDPTIVYNGPTEKYIYCNMNTNLRSHNRNQFEECPSHNNFPSRKLANPTLMDKRYVRIMKVPEVKQFAYNNDTYGSHFGRHDTLNWKQNSSNVRNTNEITFKAIKKIKSNPAIATQWKQGKKVLKQDDKASIVQTTESHYRIPNNLLKNSYTNTSLGFSPFSDNNLILNKYKGIGPASGDTCLAKVETAPAVCHPSCAPPKFPRDQSIPNKGDKEYAAVLSGELTEKIVQKILDKITKNEKMACEFGLCCKNMTEMRAYYVNISSACTACTALYGELQCFLTWLLSADLTRKHRSHYFNIKPERNYLFDEVFLNPWPRNEKINSIALPPSMFGFSQQPMYSFGNERYTSKLFPESPDDDEDIRDNRLVYRSKIVLFPEDEE